MTAASSAGFIVVAVDMFLPLVSFVTSLPGLLRQDDMCQRRGNHARLAFVPAAMQETDGNAGAQAMPDDALARVIVRDGVSRYFAARRARVGPFVDRHFSLAGTLRLHRAALGWDIARAPLNLALAAPQAGTWVAAAGARRLGTSADGGGVAWYFVDPAHRGGTRGRLAGEDRTAGVAHA